MEIIDNVCNIKINNEKAKPNAINYNSDEIYKNYRNELKFDSGTQSTSIFEFPVNHKEI